MMPLPANQWAEQIFGSALLNDSRRTDRLVKSAAQIAAHTGKSVPVSCEGYKDKVKGAYRLLENKDVDPMAIAEAGFSATALMAKQSKLIIAAEDSSTLSYKHAVRTQLGDLGGPEDSISKGLWAHTVLLTRCRNRTNHWPD